MSIDRGKLLAVVEEMTAPLVSYKFTPSQQAHITSWANKLRALAQPAEAVNPDLCPACKTWPVDDDSCPNCGREKPFTPAEAVEGSCKWSRERIDGIAARLRASGDEEAATLIELQCEAGIAAEQELLDTTHDAAQGAVAKVVGFDRGLPDLEWVNTVPLAKGDNLYTHPQVAPAQGDGKEWIAGYMQGANDYVGGAQGALDQDELRADAEMAQRHYAAELAAAPSQEGE